MSYQPISHFFGTPTSTFFFRQCIFFYGRSLFLEFIERERERERERVHTEQELRERETEEEKESPRRAKLLRLQNQKEYNYHHRQRELITTIYTLVPFLKEK